MINYFKIKKYRFLVLFLLLASNYYCNSQNLLAVDGLENPNGRPILVKLNLTNAPLGCTSRTVTLNIGKLAYIPSSNIVPVETIVTPTITSGETILSISGITNETGGFSRSISIGAQFAPGTCDYTKQEITASINFIGCNTAPINASPVTVTSKTPNSALVSLSRQTIEPEPYCLRKIIKYRLDVTNNGNTGFNIINPQVFLELDKCAEVIGIYKRDTYESVNPIITQGTNTQTAVFNIPDLILSPNNLNLYYDLYVTYPCLDGINDCTPGVKNISTYLKGKSCGSDILTNTVTEKTQIATSTASCGDVSCSAGGGTGFTETPNVSLNGKLPCPTACNPSIYMYYYLNIPPFNLSYPNQEFTIDIPAGLNFKSFSTQSSPCATPFSVKYINDKGEKSSTRYAGSLTRKVEFTTSCSLTSPSKYFLIWFDYDDQKPPLPDTELSFNYKFISDGITIINDNQSKKVEKCYSNVYVTPQVKKVTETSYDNNYNASGVPGEIFTYRLTIANNGTGADVNTTITDVLNEKLEYAGGFKYAFGNLTYESLLGNSSFTIPDLGTVTVTTPKIGESGAVRLAGFNFPCTNKYLYIEFNVRVKDQITALTKIVNTVTVQGFSSGNQYIRYYGTSYINIVPFSYVKTRMFVKCSLADEWNDNGINVKNGEEVDFKMQVINAGSNPVLLSELINLKPQSNDQYEFGSGPRNSTFKINYNCELPKISTNLNTIPTVDFKYAQNSVSMDRGMLCPPQASGNAPNWTSSCDLNANWFKATFPKNFTLNPGDFVEVVYKGKISGNSGIANNTFAFKVVNNSGNCDLVSDNSNLLAIKNDGIGIGCKSCTLTNPNAIEVKKLFENLLKNIITRVVNGEADSKINGTNPNELFLLKPYITGGGGEKIHHFVSIRNAQNKITSIRFSFSADSENDVSFIEENGLDYNPEVGAVDNSYLRIDTSLFASPTQYLVTCRKLTGETGIECKNKTEVRHVDFCPDKFCLPFDGKIKVIVP
jgi:fimbrial isopeptide formation D2 family protein